ncbi:MAG: type 1 glutamine amidotransferase-like domain-containing protein [Chloroflexi bacterium]|nr:type 1 glutamine amidotransferase-like domain-containing protein [Chloroflexota bacterium]
MSHTLLFLIGDTVANDAVAQAFVPAAGGSDAKIAVLLQNSAGWENYKSKYIEPWIQRGIFQIEPITPDENGTLDLTAVSAILRDATGIFICGGHTPTYHRLYATEPIRSIIRERYHDGVPVAGVSAGALISLENCVLPADETGDTRLKIVSGLGLVNDIVIGVHFTERNDLPNVLDVMLQTQTRTAWGIDEPACAVFEDGQFKGTLGRSIYKIIMSDFDTQSYQMTECVKPYKGDQKVPALPVVT